MNFLIYLILIFIAYKVYSIYSSKPKKEEPISFTVSKSCQLNEDKDSDYDNYEGTYYGSVKDEIPYSHKFTLKYKDGNGRVTTRNIVTKKIGETFDGDYMLLAYCELRNANRTFYASRMIELADLDTGEFIDDKCDFFKSRIDDYFNSDEYKEMVESQNRMEFKYSFISKYKEVFEVMSYIVRVDGTFSQKERVIAREYVKKLESDGYLTDEMIDSIFKNFGLITYQSFQAKIRKIDDSDMVGFDILEFAKDIVATQKTSTDMEDKIVAYLEKRKTIKK